MTSSIERQEHVEVPASTVYREGFVRLLDSDLISNDDIMGPLYSGTLPAALGFLSKLPPDEKQALSELLVHEATQELLATHDGELPSSTAERSILITHRLRCCPDRARLLYAEKYLKWAASDSTDPISGVKLDEEAERLVASVGLLSQEEAVQVVTKVRADSAMFIPADDPDGEHGNDKE